MDAGNWISLAGVVISGAAAAWAVLSAKRAATAEAAAAHHQVRAEQNAERATQAAEDASASQRRAADALETQNRMREDEAERAEGVPWRIAHRAGDTYDLWNDSDTPKFGVSIGGEGVLRPKTVDRIDGHSSEGFFGLNAMGVGDRIEVTWHRRADLSDEQREWRGNKPPRL